MSGSGAATIRPTTTTNAPTVPPCADTERARRRARLAAIWRRRRVAAILDAHCGVAAYRRAGPYSGDNGAELSWIGRELSGDPWRVAA